MIYAYVDAITGGQTCDVELARRADRRTHFHPETL